MNSSNRPAPWALTVCALLGAVLAPHTPAEPGDPATVKRFTLERLYSLPRLIGSEPRDYSWAPDSRHLAFLWDESGFDCYDVWLTSVDDPTPRRVTSVAHRAEGDTECQSEVSALAWHPDGEQLLFVAGNRVHTVAPGDAPERIDAADGPKRSVRFSPDGAYLAYVIGGDLWRHPIGEAGEPTRLTDFPETVGVADYRWSPDGEAIALLQRDERRVPQRKIPDYLNDGVAVERVRRAFPGDPAPRYRLGVIDVNDGALRWVTLGGSPVDRIYSFAWSPRGERLLVDTSNLEATDRRLLAVNVGDAQATTLYRERDSHNVSTAWQAQWAPDGQGVYFLSDNKGWDYHIWRIDEAGAEPEATTDGQWAVASFHVAGERDALYFVANKRRPEERHVYRIGLDGGEPVRLSQRPGTHEPTVSPDGRYAAVRFSSDAVPPDLWLMPLTDDPGETTRVTDSPLEAFDDYRWVTPKYVRFDSRIDDASLSGRLTVPPDIDKHERHPAILGSVYSNTVRNQWGGRQAHPTWGLDQYLVQEGYILFNVDFRGSWGHGKAFRRGIRRDYGGIDVEDLHSGAAYLKGLDYVDPARIGIWGSSYGGLLTAMSLFKKPGVYCAGVAGAPATNVHHATTWEMRVMGEPRDNPEAYASSSAYTHAEGLADPLMIIHGMRDRIVLYRDTLALMQKLMRADRAHHVELVALPDARHGWDAEQPFEARFTYRKLVEHFQRHLGRGPSAKPVANDEPRGRGAVAPSRAQRACGDESRERDS